MQDKYLKFSEIKVLPRLNQYGLDSKKLRKLASLGEIEFRKDGKSNIYSFQSLLNYVKQIDDIRENFIPFGNAISRLCKINNQASRYFKVFESVCLKKGFDWKHLSIAIDRNFYFISKKSVEFIQTNYITLEETAEQLGYTDLWYFKKKFDEQEGKIDTIIINPNWNRFIFINKKDINKLQAEDSAQKFYTKSKVIKVLGIAKNRIDLILNEFKIMPVHVKGSGIYYCKNEINLLREKQIKLFNKYMNNYYTRQEAAKVLGIQTKSLTSNDYMFTYQELPAFLKINRDGWEFKSVSSTTLIPKKEVDDLKKIKDSQQRKQELFNTSYDDLNLVYNAIVEEKSYKFSEIATNTSVYWTNYVQNRLNSANGNPKSMRTLTLKLIASLELLINLTFDKEIYNVSEKELNIALFNKNVEISYQLLLYNFIRELNKAFRKKGIHCFNMSLIKNPKNKYKEITGNTEKSIYPVTQYLSLLDYVGNILKHKENSLNDIANIQKSTKYVQYASTWLYVMIHLNNAWRHYDVTLLPRIDLTNTSVGDLHWLRENNLSDNDVNMIVNQFKRKRFLHGKTKKDRRFICSEELKGAFATAAAICELRCQKYAPNSKYLIDFESTNRDLTQGSHNAFFREFGESIEFQSLKANRTLISYMYDVIKKTTNRNPLEITKYIRSHADVETTNIYVDIPQEHLDFITTQLFGLGNFGYIYDIMSVLVIGEAPTDREERTKQALVIKDLFGSIYRIEELAGYIEALEKEKNVVEKIISGLTSQELEVKYNLIKLNQLQAKQENYQCLVAENECIFKGRNCQQCPLSIPNFYSLSSLGDSLAIKIKEFHNDFYSTNLPAEKSRIAKLIYSELALMKQAVERFGEKEVSFFIKGGIDQLRTEAKTIPSLKRYIQVRDQT